MLVARVVLAAEWPQWRGSHWDSVSREKHALPDQLDKDKNLIWRLPLPGPGGSSPVVWRDRIFVTAVEGERLLLICAGLDGKILWQNTLEGINRNTRDDANSASPSASTDGKHVWSIMTNGVIECFTNDGRRAWKTDLQQEYGKFDIQFGMTSTPIVDRGRIYCQLIHGSMEDRDSTSEGWVIALDAATGREIWKHRRQTNATMENKHSYASPTIYRDQNREFLITHGGDFAIGHSLVDGAELWRCGGMNPAENYNQFLRLVSSPVCVDGMIVIPTAKRGPVLALKPELSGDVTGSPEHHLWRTEGITPDVATPLVYDGCVYLARENGTLACLDAKSGELLYEERLMADRHRSTPAAGDFKVYIAGRDGVVHVIRAGRRIEISGKCELGEETTASPAIAGGRIFIRTYQALYAFGEAPN
jgi:outer membrane protein assembly factor BamB